VVEILVTKKGSVQRGFSGWTKEKAAQSQLKNLRLTSEKKEKTRSEKGFTTAENGEKKGKRKTK